MDMTIEKLMRREEKLCFNAFAVAHKNIKIQFFFLPFIYFFLPSTCPLVALYGILFPPQNKK